MYFYKRIKNKSANNLYYSLYSFENSNDASDNYKYLFRLLDEKYNGSVFSFYYDEIDSYYCDIKINGCWYRIDYNCETNFISLSNVDDKYDEKIMDELSVYAFYNIIENLAKKNSLESKK